MCWPTRHALRGAQASHHAAPDCDDRGVMFRGMKDGGSEGPP